MIGRFASQRYEGLFKLYSDGDLFDTAGPMVSMCLPQGPEARSFIAMDLLKREGTSSYMDISSEIGLSVDRTRDLMDALTG